MPLMSARRKIRHYCRRGVGSQPCFIDLVDRGPERRRHHRHDGLHAQVSCCLLDDPGHCASISTPHGPSRFPADFRSFPADVAPTPGGPIPAPLGWASIPSPGPVAGTPQPESASLRRHFGVTSGSIRGHIGSGSIWITVGSRSVHSRFTGGGCGQGTRPEGHRGGTTISKEMAWICVLQYPKGRTRMASRRGTIPGGDGGERCGSTAGWPWSRAQQRGISAAITRAFAHAGAQIAALNLDARGVESVAPSLSGGLRRPVLRSRRRRAALNELV